MQSLPGLSTVETLLRNIVQGINGLNTAIEDVAGEVTGVSAAVTAAFPPPLTSSATWNPANLLTLTQDTTTIAVSGAALGMSVQPSFSLDLQGQILTAYVSSANTVTAVLFNSTVGTINLGSGILKVMVYA